MLSRFVSKFSAPSMVRLSSQQFSTDFKKKGTADEKHFFTKQDEQLLKNLLKKMEKQNEEMTDTQRIEKAEKELQDLCAQHGVKPTNTLIHDLMDWKFE